jgi:DNA-binding transcriptional regulator PaaX
MLPRWRLPADWPAERAQAVFRGLLAEVASDARHQVTRLLAQPAEGS